MIFTQKETLSHGIPWYSIMLPIRILKLVASIISKESIMRGNRNFTVCVEGNIGSGKTTFLNNFRTLKNTTVLQEPIQLWRDVAGVNLLEAMYKNPDRYASLFQSYVQLTMLQLHACKTPSSYKIMERSAYSACIFIENMKRMKTLEDVEIYVLEAWQNWAHKNIEIETDLIVYLRTSPEIVYERMKKRARKEEDYVSFEYLNNLHKIHDEWLLEQKLFPLSAPVLVIDGNKNIEEMVTEFNTCKDNIYNRVIPYEGNNEETVGETLKAGV